jgi:prepilin-type N-terminal cleavage/methylation domain-containing protein/prepilin-type processing-associated H-X9-DG protein
MIIQSKPNRALTLIELLVVIGVIAVLAGLLLPVVGRAKATAHKATCINNHRQMILAWQLYADDFGGRLPPNVAGSQGIAYTNWVAGHLYNLWERENTDLLVEPQRTLLASYAPNAKIYKCPSDRSELARSVSMNNRMGPATFPAEEGREVLGGHGTNFMVYRRTSEFRKPVKLFVTIDERNDSINDAYFAVDLSNTGSFSGAGSPDPYWWIDSAGMYHNNGAVLSFADGHVEHRKWLEPTSLVWGPRHTSAVDRDLVWLQERTAERIHQQE